MTEDPLTRMADANPAHAEISNVIDFAERLQRRWEETLYSRLCRIQGMLTEAHEGLAESIESAAYEGLLDPASHAVGLFAVEFARLNEEFEASQRRVRETLRARGLAV